MVAGQKIMVVGQMVEGQIELLRRSEKRDDEIIGSHGQHRYSDEEESPNL